MNASDLLSSRRRQTWSLVVAVLALVAAADAAAAPAGAPATVTVKSGAGATLAPEFVGLSFEVNLLAQPGLTAGNLATYLETLGQGVLRFGGNQVDKAFWTS